MSECKAVCTPLERNAKLCSDDETKEVDGTLYCQLVGSLNYLTTTRLDIAYLVNILSQLMAKPHYSHWIETKKVLHYLKGTIDFGIMYTDEYDVELAGFSDLDWAGNLDDKRCTSGYAFNIGLGVLSCHGVERNNQLFICHQMKLIAKACPVQPMKQFG